MTGITIIGLVGLAGTGKDSAAAILAQRYGFLQDGFAAPIRSMARDLLRSHGLPLAFLDSRELKEAPLPVVGVSPRRIMQQIGGGMREADDDFWVQLAALRLGLHALPTSTPVHDRIVLSDVRYRNEAAWIRGLGGKLIRLMRVVPGVHPHESEQQAGRIACDATILNDGTLDDLHRKVDEALHTLRLDLRAGSTALLFGDGGPGHVA